MKRRRDCQHFHFGPFGKKIIFMFSCFMTQKKLFWAAKKDAKTLGITTLCIMTLGMTSEMNF
jgi:hypothetical protein